MSANINQIFIANPSSALATTDLVYLGKSPYGATNDSAITASNFFINTFNTSFNTATLKAVTNQLILGTTHTVTINAPAPSANRIYAIPDIGLNANFVLSQGAQSIGGAITFLNPIVFSSATPIKMNGGGSTNIILAIVGPVGDNTYTFPDAGRDANILLDQGVKTIAGVTTFSDSVTFSNSSVSQSVANSGAAVTMTVQNTSNTATSDALLKIAVGGTSANDPYVLYNIPSGTSWVQGSDNSDSDAFVLSVGTAIGTANAMHVDTTGRFTYPSQPRFRASKSSTTTNVTGDGTQAIVVFDSESYDVGSNYDNGNGSFVAPITATYLFETSITFSSVGASHTSISQDLLINASTVIATNSGSNPGNGRDSANNYMSSCTSRRIALNAGDSVQVRIAIGGSTKTVGVLGNAFFSTFFSGMLVA